MHKRAIVLLMLLAACKHAGGGEGTLETPKSAAGASESKGPVVFTWNSGADPASGTISATLPDGKRFDGTYLQVTSTTSLTSTGPYYDAWTATGWGGSSAWYSGGAEGFVTEYSGLALAHLTNPAGTRMRCKFALRKPSSGLEQGAVGQCQLSDGETIFDAKLKETHG
jgi:hypothetical protein